MQKLILILSILILGACTDARMGKVKVLGSSARVTCFSGGKKIFDAFSTGKVENETHSDGYFAKYRLANKDGEPSGKPFYASVSGDCTIVYLTK